MEYDIKPFVNWVTKDFLPLVHIGLKVSDYARRAGGEHTEVYGAGDAACILYTIDELFMNPSERIQWSSTLRSFQDAQSGYFIAKTAYLSKVHNTAFTLAAMNLFDVKPKYYLTFSRNFDSSEKMQEFINSCDWTNNVYQSGENVIGLASSFTLVPGTVSSEWFDWFFDHCNNKLFDVNNGMVGLDTPSKGTIDQIGGTFHFAFLWDFYGLVMPFSKKRIDSILNLQQQDGTWSSKNVWWLSFDAVYMLIKAVKSSDYRLREIHDCVHKVLKLLLDYAMDQRTREKIFMADDMGVHSLNCFIQFFAIAQEFLGETVVKTNKPLKLVLNKRPYI